MLTILSRKDLLIPRTHFLLLSFTNSMIYVAISVDIGCIIFSVLTVSDQPSPLPSKIIINLIDWLMDANIITSTRSDAIRLNLPAECTLFREHSQGLYYCKSDTFDFIKIVQAIWMQSLSTDVLIIFNSYDPVKLVQKVILNSSTVQEAFKKSCHTLQENFFDGIDLATDESSISYLFQFLVEEFIRVYAKDIYQLRLSNALLSKTGASGIRTNLLSLSAASEKTKDLRATAVSAPCINNSNE